jgi:hypothetical protein
MRLTTGSSRAESTACIKRGWNEESEVELQFLNENAMRLSRDDNDMELVRNLAETMELEKNPKTGVAELAKNSLTQELQ